MQELLLFIYIAGVVCGLLLGNIIESLGGKKDEQD